MDRLNSKKIGARLVCTAAVWAILASSALAQNADFALPAQPLSQSLEQISRQTGESILFTPQSVAGIQANPLTGRMSAHDAVDRLLQGTKLEAASDGGNGLVIRAAISARRSEIPSPNIMVAQASSPPASDGSLGGAPPQAAPSIEQVVVSASRISIAGYQAPTPVTVVSADQLLRDAQNDIGDAVRQLPTFGGSTAPDNSRQSGLVGTGAAGLNEVSLRNLGPLRTLVLVDGQRMVSSNIQDAVVDLSTIPSTLITRIDVVTGGASAAWGSDAVAGVVNLILNKNLVGLRANIEFGDNSSLNHESMKVEASYGTSFAGERGHFIISGSYRNSPQTFFAGQAPWNKNTRLVNNPAYAPGNGQPMLIHADNVGSAQYTAGGLIVAGPLKGIQFVGPSGTPAPFDFGNVSGGSLSNGGSAEMITDDLSVLSVPIRTQTVLAYGSYKLTDNLMASLQFNYGGSSLENNSAIKVDRGDITIKADNPYIPSSIVDSMTTQHISSFTFGTANTNNLELANGHATDSDYSFSAQSQSLGVPISISHRQLLRVVASLDGSLGGSWSWNAYYQHGIVRLAQNVINNVESTNLSNAIDAVKVTSANVGASGLQIGNIVCRSTLSNPRNGCAPLDVFGNEVASSAAIQYVNGDARNGGDAEVQIINQDVAAVSMQGELPWGFQAGPPSVAFGGEYRKEAARGIASPLALATVFNIGNFSNFEGEYNVWEGFAEIDAPLLKNDFVQSLDFNAAGRLTDYSISGLVETWKLGLTSQLNEDVKLRATWSFDIRAPDLYELFLPGLHRKGSAIDPHTGIGVSVFNFQSGNLNLKPEQSVTLSGGIVLTPHWIGGLTVSADWYSISIKKAIVNVSPATILANCNAGQAFYCAQLEFNGPGGALSQIDYGPLNADAQTVSGLDFAADYGMDFFSGHLNFHLVGSYTDEQTQTTQGVLFDYAGSVGPQSPYQGVPKFKATLAMTYLQGPWSGTLQTRITGTARLNNAWGPLDVDNNNVPAVAYLDVRASYNWTDNLQLYTAIDNTLDTPPPQVAGSAAGGGIPTRDDLYSAFGRTFRVGIRLTY